MSRDTTLPKRTFLKVALLANGVVGALLAIPVLRYVLSPAIKPPAEGERWVTLGATEKFPVGETRLASFRNAVERPSDGVTANIPCWVRNVDGQKFQVFAINCAHLGCPVRWFPESNLFLCPCHGGAYYADGERASGPPERGLFEYPYRITAGELWILPAEMPTPGAVARNDAPRAHSGALALADGKRRLPCV
ncbi:MAG TPA: Rieske 2Fe-2S domain-containing protein [Polyangiaceae bacterium]|jgi:Rieske Fe-S protein